MPNAPIPFTNLPSATALSGDELVPIVQGGTNKTATTAQLAFLSTGTAIVSSNATFAQLNVTSTATIAALTVSSNILGLNAIVSNLAALSTATFAAATVSSNFSALNSSFTTLTVSGSATFSSTATFAAVTVSSNMSVLNASIATLDVSSAAVIESLSVSSNVTLGSSTATLTINETAITKPNLPAFLATSSATTAGVTGVSTVYTVIFGSELYDRTNSYSTATGIFTAPVPGIYSFCGSVELINLTSNHTSLSVNLMAGGITFGAGFRAFSSYPTMTTYMAQWSIQRLLSSGQTAFVQTTVVGASGGVGVVGSTITVPTYFGGYLVG